MTIQHISKTGTSGMPRPYLYMCSFRGKVRSLSRNETTRESGRNVQNSSHAHEHVYNLASRNGVGFFLSKRHIFSLACYKLAARCASRGR